MGEINQSSVAIIYLQYILDVSNKWRVKMKKLINFKTSWLIKDIQKFADDNFEGNFSQAVRQLIIKGLNKAGE